MKRVGVLGGYGPAATAHFFTQLVKATPATRDWEHLHIIVNNNPRVPSRARAFIYGEEDPTALMKVEIERLRISGADFFVCPCNSAHYFLRKINNLPLPMIDMVELTMKHIEDSGYKRALLLGTEVTMRSGMYSDLASRQGILIEPYVDSSQIRAIIESGKTGVGVDKAREALAEIIKQADKDFDCVIFGCTELPLVFDGSGLDRPIAIVDTAHVLAEETVRYATYE